jgi:hypothetical protein
MLDLTNGNVRNFYKMQGQYKWFARIAWTDLLHLHLRALLTASIRRRGISAPRFIKIKCPCGGWRVGLK